MATIHYAEDCDKLVLGEANIAPRFFNLGSGFAGEVLQKYINYGMKIAIVRDFKKYPGKSRRDFIYESNRGQNCFFLETEQAAIAVFHGVED